MSYEITLITSDDKQINFSCLPTQSVQEAAESSGFFLPAMCQAGSCGSCVAVCRSGDYTLESYSRFLLPDNPAEGGHVLLCRLYPKSDLTLQTPYVVDKICNQKAIARDAEVVSIEKIAERTTRLVLQLQPDDQHSLSFEFEPGQYVELEIPELELKRAYSLANAPNWDGSLEFLIRTQPQGRFAHYLEQATVGQRLKVHGPAGDFCVRQQGLNPRCFVAGGTGLAPFLSTLRQMAEWGTDHPTTLFLGVTNEQELFCQQELAELVAAIPQLSVEICVWQASDAWQGFVGTPVDALRLYLNNTSNLSPDIYLCGPPMLVESAIAVAHEAGIKDDQIFCERF